MSEISQDYIDHISRQLAKDELADFFAICQRPLRKSIRVNTLKISTPDFLERVKKYQWKLTPIPWCEQGFWLERPEAEEAQTSIGNCIEHILGLFYVQEASSMLPPEALLNFMSETPQRVLDMAASPGSKTTQLIAKTQNQTLVIANEISASRLKYLYGNLCRTGSINSCLTHKDGRDFGSIAKESFDAILLDAPCTGEGTVRKNTDALKNWSIKPVLQMAKLQKELIISAFEALKPGGRLVYSTCTISREENQQVCQFLLEKYHNQCSVVPLEQLFSQAEKAATKEGYLHILPHLFDSEGFFVACFQKQGQLETSTPLNIETSGHWNHMSTQLKQSFEEFLTQQFNFNITAFSGVLLTKEQPKHSELWMFPQHLNGLLKKLQPNRSGIKLGEVRQKGKNTDFRISHEFAMAFGAQFHRGYIEITKTQLQQFITGKDLPLEKTLDFKGDCLIKLQGYPLGLTRVVGSRLKNKLPRELIRDNWKG